MQSYVKTKSYVKLLSTEENSLKEKNLYIVVNIIGSIKYVSMKIQYMLSTSSIMKPL